MTMEGFRGQISGQLGGDCRQESCRLPQSSLQSTDCGKIGAGPKRSPEGGEYSSVADVSGSCDDAGPLGTAAFGASSSVSRSKSPPAVDVPGGFVGANSSNARCRAAASGPADDMEFETRRAVPRAVTSRAEVTSLPDDMEFETRRAVPRIATTAQSRAAPEAEDMEFETRRAIPRVPVPVPAPVTQYSVNDSVWVFSSSQGQWLRARVTKVEAGIVTVVYRLLDGGEAKKQLMTSDEALKPASFEPPGASLHKVQPGQQHGGGVTEWSETMFQRSAGPGDR